MHVDTSKPHGFLINADRVNCSAGRRVIQIEPDDRHGEAKQQRWHRQRPDKATAKGTPEQRIERVFGRRGINVEETAQTPHRRQRYDERLQAELCDDEAIQ